MLVSIGMEALFSKCRQPIAKGVRRVFKELVAVAIGGMCGCLLRHGLGWLLGMKGAGWLPIATLVANLLGCFAIGYLYQWSTQQQLTKEWWVVGVRVGLLGGLTTFSSFGLDVVRMWSQNRALAIALLSAHVLLGVAAVVIGIRLAEQPQPT